MTKSPLTWPAGWRRTKGENRKRAAFKNDGGRLTIADGKKRIIAELVLFGVHAEDTIISTNLELNRDGTPRSNQGEPRDPGVAVYWKKTKDAQHKVMACDLYDRVADNLAAIAATLNSMRRIERHGGAVVLERAFTGFLSLPAPNTWRAVMGYEEDETPPRADVREKYRTLSKKRHPDSGGSEAMMSELNWAWAEAQRELP